MLCFLLHCVALGGLHRAVKNMLSESSVASVVYYWLEFRDDLTPQWLKQFTRHNGDIQEIGWHRWGHLFIIYRSTRMEYVKTE